MVEQQSESKVAKKMLYPLPGRSRLVSVAGVALLFLLTGFFLGRGADANPAAVPGSETDPLVTASWVEARLNAFVQGLSGLPQPGAPLPVAPSPGIIHVAEPPPAYTVVVVQAGRQMLLGEGTEFILRSGRARALVPVKGTGLANLTEGKNLNDGEAVQRDHLILSPRDDGRGIVAETEAIFLVKNKYRIN